MRPRFAFARGLVVGFIAGIAVTNLWTNSVRASKPSSAMLSKAFDEIDAKERLAELSALGEVVVGAAKSEVESSLRKAVVVSSGASGGSINLERTVARNTSQQEQARVKTPPREISNDVHSIVSNFERPREKPSIAVVLCVYSGSKRQKVLEKDKILETMSISKLLIPSLKRTIESENFNYTIFIGMDTTDVFWNNPAIQTELRNQAGPSLPIEFRAIPPNNSRIPFNEILKVAYDMGSEYMIRINDDSEFVTGNWSSQAVYTLASLDPPNVGVVGPTCYEGNTYILTHDFVHRTHMDIFEGVYYSKVFGNWWLDDWITWSYVPRRMRKLDNWIIKHHVNHHGTRYKVDAKKERLVRSEVQKGKETVDKWLLAHNHSKEAESLSVQFDVLLIVDESIFEFFLNWWAHYIQLPDNGISNVFIVAEDQSVYDKLTESTALEKLRKRRAIVDFSPRIRKPTAKNPNNTHTHPDRIMTYLGKGRNIVYCDVHILWTSDPFYDLPTSPSPIDMYINVDNATYEDHTPYYDGEFMIMYASTFLINFLAEWNLKLRNKVGGERPGLNDLIKRMHTMTMNKKMTPLALPFDKFPNGKAYFEEFSQEQRDNVAVVHNNYLADLDAKKQRLVKHDLWKPFLLL